MIVSPLRQGTPTYPRKYVTYYITHFGTGKIVGPGGCAKARVRFWAPLCFLWLSILMAAQPNILWIVTTHPPSPNGDGEIGVFAQGEWI